MPQTLFITGASTGIGKVTALHFRNQGWNVAATLRNPAADTELAAAGVRTIALDVTDKATIQPALDGALAAFGRIDVLVNNAGYGTFGPFEAATDEQIERQYATNVTGLMYVTRAFLPHFRAKRRDYHQHLVGGRSLHAAVLLAVPRHEVGD
jgi:NAD(P)-dependent dehydrogenase (short-subunit alcohol dehydrogenase family)